MKLLEHVLSRKKEIQIVLFVAYCGFIVWMTLLNRHQYEHRIIRLELFWAFREWKAGEPYGKVDSILYLKNILFFMPFGFLIPIKKSWKQVTVTAVLVSVAIELIQVATKYGECEIDDVISNTVGALVGFWIYIILLEVMNKMIAIKKGKR